MLTSRYPEPIIFLTETKLLRHGGNVYDQMEQGEHSDACPYGALQLAGGVGRRWPGESGERKDFFSDLEHPDVMTFMNRCPMWK